MLLKIARLSVCCVLLAMFSSRIAAQTSSDNPDSTGQTPAQPSSQSSSKDGPASNQQNPAQPAKQTDKDKPAPDTSTQGKVAGTSNDRLFFTLPNFLSVQNAGRIPPLTAKQKFAVVARSSFDPVQYPWYAFLSGISQAEDSEPGFGQGAAGYGKRFATAFSDGTIENFMTSAVMPSLLRQDPRFFQSGQGTFFHRTGYAVSRIFITRTDSGHSQFNFSEIIGSAMAASISTFSYHPRSRLVSTPTNPHLFIPSDRTLKNTASVWGSEIGYDTITFVVKEFWPDVHRKLSHKQQSAQAKEGGSTP